MLEHENESKERKYDWAEKWIKMTGERAMIDAKVNDTYIVYQNENGQLVKEYPSGKILEFTNEESRKQNNESK